MGANCTALKVAITYYGQLPLGLDPEATAALLQRLAGEHMRLVVEGLNGTNMPDVDVRTEAVETQMEEVVSKMPGIKRVDFSSDPRGGATVGLVFTNGESNGFSTGLWKIFQD